MQSTLEEPHAKTLMNKSDTAHQVILKSVDDAIVHYEATGLHISLDEAKTWAQELRTDRNAQLPACHI